MWEVDLSVSGSGRAYLRTLILRMYGCVLLLFDIVMLFKVFAPDLPDLQKCSPVIQVHLRFNRQYLPTSRTCPNRGLIFQLKCFWHAFSPLVD